MRSCPPTGVKPPATAWPSTRQQYCDRAQSVGGPEPVTDAELVEQGQGVREELVGGDRVAGELGRGRRAATRRPARAISVATVAPAQRAPTTIASYWRSRRCCHGRPSLPSGCGNHRADGPWKGRGSAVERDHGEATRSHAVGGTEAGVDLARRAATARAASRRSPRPLEQPRPGRQGGGLAPGQAVGGEHLQGPAGCRASAASSSPRAAATAARASSTGAAAPRQSSPPARISSHRCRWAAASAGPLGGEQLGELGPGSQLGRHLRSPQPRAKAPSPATPSAPSGRRGRAAPSASHRRFSAASCRSPAASSAATAAAQDAAACSHRPSRTGSIRRATGVRRQAVRRLARGVDLAQGGQRERELVDDGVVGVGERREPRLAQPPPAPGPRGGGVQEVGVEQQRRRVDRRPAEVRVGQLVGGAPAPLPVGPASASRPWLTAAQPLRPAGDHRQVAPVRGRSAIASARVAASSSSAVRSPNMAAWARPRCRW